MPSERLIGNAALAYFGRDVRPVAHPDAAPVRGLLSTVDVVRPTAGGGEALVAQLVLSVPPDAFAALGGVARDRLYVLDAEGGPVTLRVVGRHPGPQGPLEAWQVSAVEAR